VPPPSTPKTTTPPPPPAPALPFAVPDRGQRQIITVAVPSAGSTTGTLTAWERSGSGWTVAIGPLKASVGKNGVGATKEGMSRTPAGTFGLTEAFGIRADPGTALPYRRVGDTDWWVSDVGSSQYNTHQVCAPAACAFNTAVSERLARIDPQYRYAVVIDYNRSPIQAGAGSAFFLHVGTGVPTAGCVSVPQTTMVSLLRWLDPGKAPTITIGVG
jgi:L,D-peptidoglycan transpeptidase YkuD (ErfK/YbiS/YcfS/YnhG family)